MAMDEGGTAEGEGRSWMAVGLVGVAGIYILALMVLDLSLAWLTDATLELACILMLAVLVVAGRRRTGPLVPAPVLGCRVRWAAGLMFVAGVCLMGWLHASAISRGWNGYVTRSVAAELEWTQIAEVVAWVAGRACAEAVIFWGIVWRMLRSTHGAGCAILATAVLYIAAVLLSQVLIRNVIHDEPFHRWSWIWAAGTTAIAACCGVARHYVGLVGCMLALLARHLQVWP